jgi:hypothetical protein
MQLCMGDYRVMYVARTLLSSSWSSGPPTVVRCTATRDQTCVLLELGAA